MGTADGVAVVGTAEGVAVVGTDEGVAVVGTLEGIAVGAGETSSSANAVPMRRSPNLLDARSSRKAAPAGTAVAGTATCEEPASAVTMRAAPASGVEPSAEKYSE